MNLTDYLYEDEQPHVKTMLYCTLELDKRHLLESLICGVITIHGFSYIVPEKYFLELLASKNYGETYVELERI